MILNLFYITLIIVFIIDYSGFITTIEDFVSKRLLGSKMKFHIPKPFSCSLCTSFWTGLIYLLTTNQFSILNLCIVCGFAASTIVLADVIAFIRDLLLTLIDLLRKLFRL